MARERSDERTVAGQAGTDRPVSISAATLKVIGAVVGPTTLLTGLLLYFGVLYAVGYYRYFGVNFTVLDLPVEDLLVLSASTAIMPLTILSACCALGIWMHGWLDHRLSGTPRRVVGTLLTASSLVLLTLVAADTLLGRAFYPSNYAEARGLSLVVGTLGLAYGTRLAWGRKPPLPEEQVPRRPNQAAPAHRGQEVVMARWGSAFILVSVGLFWAVGSYAIKVGTTDAQGLASDLSCLPDVTLYSAKSLNLGMTGVRENVAATDNSAYGYRYSNFKLVPQAGPSYLLIPEDWSSSSRPALLLARSDTTRLEFTVSLRTSLGEC